MGSVRLDIHGLNHLIILLSSIGRTGTNGRRLAGVIFARVLTKESKHYLPTACTYDLYINCSEI